MADFSTMAPMVTIGLDVGDIYCQVCALDAQGEVVEEGRLRTNPEALKQRFGSATPMRVALEVGQHSHWISRLLRESGHEVIVANARKLRLIYENDRKNDRIDAEYLARLARLDPRLLSPLQHRGVQTQQDLEVLKARDLLATTRTRLINHVRGVVKVYGLRIPKYSSGTFNSKAAGHLPPEHHSAVQPLLDMIGSLTVRVREYDKQIEQLCEQNYPQTQLLTQVTGVGPLTALTYVLTLEDPHRFPSSRSVGSYVGLARRESRSGGHDPELRITKAGDRNLRRLLVQSAQYILGPFGPDTDLRRWGLALAARGRKNAKKRAVVAVARKLAVLLHRLWITAEVYEPLRQTAKNSQAQVAAA
jgi:transposase